MRVFVYGPPGAGKTTLALALGRRWGVPVHHLDRVFFHRGGAPVAWAVGAAETARLAAGEAWVIEGNHGAALEVAAARAQRVAVLRLGRWRSLWRIARRRVRTPPELRDKGPGGGPHLLPWHLARHTLLVHPRTEPEHLAKIKRAAAGEVRSFDRPRDTLAWLETPLGPILQAAPSTAERRGRADVEAARRILRREGGQPPASEDELAP